MHATGRFKRKIIAIAPPMPLAIAPGRFAHHTVARHPDKLKSPSRSDLSSPRTEASVEHPRTGGRKVSFSPVELSSIEGKSPTVLSVSRAGAGRAGEVLEVEVLLESIPLIGPVKYLVQVSSKLNAASWGRLRRYREFDALHRELLSLGLEPLQPMPPKGVRRNPVDLTERAAHLTQYTNALLKVPEILTSPQLADFLELEKVLGAGLLSPVPLASLGGAAFGSPLSGKSKSPSTSTDLSSSLSSSPDLEARLLARIGAVELVGPEGRARGADLVRRGALVAALALLCGGALLLAPPQAAGAGATGGAGRAVVRKAAPTEINLSFGTTLAARSPPPARRSPAAKAPPVKATKAKMATKPPPAKKSKQSKAKAKGGGASEAPKLPMKALGSLVAGPVRAVLTPLNAGIASAFKLLKSGPWQGRLRHSKPKPKASA